MMKAVRPPWIDDYEKLEVEVANLYRDYLDKFRNVAYLEVRLNRVLAITFYANRFTFFRIWIYY